MQKLIDFIDSGVEVDSEDWLRLRRGLLLIEREKTRMQGQRVLTRMAEQNLSDISPLAQAGLALSYHWSGNLRDAMYWMKMSIANYPMTSAAVWCASLLVSTYRMMGMKRERFEAERERILLMRKIAFQSENRHYRIYALNELVKELESRDLPEDAKKCAQELEDLMSVPTHEESYFPA